MIITNEFNEYVVHTEKGMKIKKDTSEKIKAEMKEINKQYNELYGEFLFID